MSLVIFGVKRTVDQISYTDLLLPSRDEGKGGDLIKEVSARETASLQDWM